MRFYEECIREIIRQNGHDMSAMINNVKWFVEEGQNKHLKINNIEEWGNVRDVLNIFYSVHTHDLNNPRNSMEYRAVITRQLFNEMTNGALQIL